jgi:hypothetical protein
MALNVESDQPARPRLLTAEPLDQGGAIEPMATQAEELGAQARSALAVDSTFTSAAPGDRLRARPPLRVIGLPGEAEPRPRAAATAALVTPFNATQLGIARVGGRWSPRGARGGRGFTATVHPTVLSVSVVIPAYNEERGVVTVVEKLRPLLGARSEILVVDDGSSDATGISAAIAGARVIRHAKNRGKGAALQTGLSNAYGEKIVVIDADDTYPVEAIPDLIKALDEYDVVLGRREAGRANISPLNRLGNNVFRHAISVAARRRVADPLTGLYGFNSSVAARLNLTSPGFGIEAEIVIKACRLKARLLEVPIGYRPRIGQSKLSPIRDGIVITRTIASLMLAIRMSPEVETTMARTGLMAEAEVGLGSE